MNRHPGKTAEIEHTLWNAIDIASGIELTRVLHAFYHDGEEGAKAEMKALAFWTWQYEFVLSMCREAEKTGVMRVFDKGVSDWVYTCFLKGKPL